MQVTQARGTRKAKRSDAVGNAVIPFAKDDVASKKYKKAQDVKIPAISHLNKLTSSDDAHRLLQVEGHTFSREDLLNTTDFDDWDDFRKRMRISHEVTARVQDKVQD